MNHGDAEQQLNYVQADGSWTQWNYDTAGTQIWSSTITDYTSSGATVDETLNLNSGSVEKRNYDLSHGDQLQTDATYNPNGSLNEWVYDTANSNGWYEYSYDALGTAAVDQTLFWRSGAEEVKIWDLAHGDQLQTDTVYNTGKTVNQWVYDTAGAYDWYKYSYDAVGTASLDQPLTFVVEPPR